MVAPAILVSKHRTTPTQLGFLSGGTTFTQLGTSVASGESWPDPQAGFPSNRAVWFKGCYFMLHFAGGRVYVLDSIGNTMFDNGGVNEPMVASDVNAVSGLFVTRSINPVMFFVTQGSSQQILLYTTTDGRNWVRTVLSATSDPTNGLGRGVLYRNQLYIMARNQTASWAFLIINPTTLTMTTFDFATFGWSTGSSNGSLCVFRNRLFLLRTATVNASNWIFYEFTGGTFVAKNTLLAGGSADATTYAGQDHFLFPVGDTKMVALAAVDTANSVATRGTKAWDLVPSGPVNFTANEKTDPLIPLSLRTVADGGPGVASPDTRWTGFVDNDFNTTPGSPRVYLWYLSTPNGGIYTYYEYINSDQELTPGTVSVSYEFALPYGSSGGGDRTFSSVGLKALINDVQPSPSPGRVRVTATLYGDIKPAVATTNISYPPTRFYGPREPVVAATTTALLSVTYNNGTSGAGATLTATANGALPAQDDVVLALNNRLLVKNQATAAHNGIYSVTQIGDGGSPFILTRTTDFDQGNLTDVLPTAWVLVTGGSTLIDTAWTFEAANPVAVMGSTAITWVQLDASGTPLNRRLRLWYSTNETPNMVQATLNGTPSKSSPNTPAQATYPPIVARNIDVLENIVADGEVRIVFDWDATVDALESGQAVHLMARAGTA